MTYTLTAEQMRQVREAWEKASTGLKRMLDMYEPDTFPNNHPAALAREGLGAAQTALALLDAAMQAPEATAGGDVREALRCLRWAMKAIHWPDHHESRRALMQNTIAALAAAPKPCEHGCVDGKLTPATLRTPELCALEKGPDGRLRNAPCPIHGTKPEATTELCKVCGEVIRPREMMCMDCGASLHDACVRAHDRDCPGPNHPFTPTDATPKDEE